MSTPHGTWTLDSLIDRYEALHHMEGGRVCGGI